MIDLHTHTLFSDGVLLPSELVYRAKVKGYKAIAITDHGDFSTFDFVIPRLIRVSNELEQYYNLKVIPGVEITYVPPEIITLAVKKCRLLGAKIVVVHGETTAETVPPGTNHSAINSGADILAHPGNITDEDVKLAKKNKVLLEITTRHGHNKTNKHVAKLANKYGAKLVFDTDSHLPEDLMTQDKIKQTLRMSGLNIDDFYNMQKNSYDIIEKLIIGKTAKNIV